MNPKPVILVTGALGQLGSELIPALRQRYGRNAIIATDILENKERAEEGPYFRLDVRDRAAIEHLVTSLGVTQIYHLAAVLSANGEKDPLGSWHLNMQSLINVLEVSRTAKLDRIFWPSSIAVFGNNAPRTYCPQNASTEPTTVYGISKCAGEHWCQYYHQRYGLDIRSLRYPGLIGHRSRPGGGTTDYAVDIFHQALQTGSYTCFLKAGTRLPMLYMPDAVRATLELMDAPAIQVKIRTSYNISGMSFTPAQLAEAIQKILPEFSIIYAPDHRQQIAESWPGSIDCFQANYDWHWKPGYDLGFMVSDMILNLRQQRSVHNAILV